MSKVYVEIVHVTDRTLILWEKHPDYKPTIDKIRHLERTVGIHYILGILLGNLPPVPFDTPVRVGGTLPEVCVQTRVEILQARGYKNVRANKSICFDGSKSHLY